MGMIRRNIMNRAAKKTAPVVEQPKDDFSQYMNPPIETKKETYTKTEINRMPISELRKLASKNGVDDVENIGGSELKKVLIEKFGL